MKGYCATRDVRLALAPLDEFAEQSTAAVLTDPQIDDAIEEAEGIVDSFVLKRFTIVTYEVDVINPADPLETWVFTVAPVPIRGITRNIAAYLCALTFRKNKDLPEDDPIRLRYALSMDMLRAIRYRTADLPIDFPPVGDTSQGVYVANLYEGDLFSLSDFGLGYGAQYDPQVILPARRDV